MVPTDVGAALTIQAGTTANASAGAINGTGIDRAVANGKRYLSAVLFAACGVPTGTPTSFTVDAKLQDSADNASFADVSPAVAIATLTAQNTGASKKVDLTGLRRYIRSVVTVAFVGGTTPAIPVQSTVVLGGSDAVPTATP